MSISLGHSNYPYHLYALVSGHRLKVRGRTIYNSPVHLNYFGLYKSRLPSCNHQMKKVNFSIKEV